MPQYSYKHIQLKFILFNIYLHLDLCTVISFFHMKVLYCGCEGMSTIITLISVPSSYNILCLTISVTWNSFS